MSNIAQVDVRRLTLYTLLLILAVVLLVAGCGDDKSSGTAKGPRFEPAEITIVIGDTIRFVAVSGDHSVTSGTGSNDPNAGNLFDEPLPKGDTYRRAFDDAGTFNYFCVPHEADGMKGKVIVTADDVDTIQVSASGVSFIPATVTIHPGDAIRWTVTGSHTITSGEDLSDPTAGNLFDENRSTGQSFVFTFGDLGSFDYFCRLHVGMGMKGTVNVVERESETFDVEALQ